MILKLDSVPMVNDAISVREIDNEIIFIEESGKGIHTTTDTGLFIYKKIDGNRSLLDIIKSVCEEYDITEEIAKNDIFEFIDDLVNKEIITII
ncbi:MAG: PqqD family protein [Spirochaetes bacterium]|nr:PqqD family protein [Spirochaetota bacterium]